ncbi:cytochrome P450 [Nonomuraea sp. NPDC050404]|uniref:cytochrome P450 n=1 Tax=Nonomuraea sp. NPDC050404 TaxID=3155783 RepID=UPI0033F03840
MRHFTSAGKNFGKPSGVPIARKAKPFIGHAWSLLRSPFAFFDALGARGDVVRMDIGRTSIYMLTRPELVHAILVTEAHSVQRRGIMFDRVRHDLVSKIGLITAEGQVHLHWRRLLQPAFHRNTVGKYVGHIQANAERLSSSWKDGQTVEVDHAVYDLITENTADSLFGVGLSAEMVDTVRRTMPILTDNLLIRVQSPKILERFPLPRMRLFDQALRELGEVTNKVITKRLEREGGNGDALGMLLQTQDPETGQPLTMDQVYDEVIGALFVGIETVATTLTWVLYELDRRPDVQAQVLDEINTLLGKGLSVSELVGQMDYTRRVVQEVLRLHPVLMIIRQVVKPLSLGGVALPIGTQIGYSPYALHRDASLYPDPLRLDPDRWLRDDERALPPGAFAPFGEGRHRCIGEYFAWTEILATLVVLLPRWSLALVPGQDVRSVSSIFPRLSSLRMTVDAR